MPAKLALYEYPSCPYCSLVLRALEDLGDLGVDVELCNVMEDRERLDELVNATGRRTVPVLRIESEDGEVEWMPESRDIIRYLQDL